MASARKCDRCGVFYTKPYKNDYYEYPFIDVPRELESHTNPYSTLYDLCPECMEKLIVWLDGNAEIVCNDEMVYLNYLREVSTHKPKSEDGPVIVSAHTESFIDKLCELYKIPKEVYMSRLGEFDELYRTYCEVNGYPCVDEMDESVPEPCDRLCTDDSVYEEPVAEYDPPGVGDLK